MRCPGIPDVIVADGVHGQWLKVAEQEVRRILEEGAPNEHGVCAQ